MKTCNKPTCLCSSVQASVITPKHYNVSKPSLRKNFTKSQHRFKTRKFAHSRTFLNMRHTITGRTAARLLSNLKRRRKTPSSRSSGNWKQRVAQFQPRIYANTQINFLLTPVSSRVSLLTLTKIKSNQTTFSLHTPVRRWNAYNLIISIHRSRPFYEYSARNVINSQ